MLTGQQFPSWSAGPDPTFREPQAPTNYGVADVQQYMPEDLRSDLLQADRAPEPVRLLRQRRPPLLPAVASAGEPPRGGAGRRLIGYRWHPQAEKFVQIPFQVDEVFTRYISNNVSGFAFYSGVDEETTYAWDREGIHYTWDEYLEIGGDPCQSRRVRAPRWSAMSRRRPTR